MNLFASDYYVHYGRTYVVRRYQTSTLARQTTSNYKD